MEERIRRLLAEGNFLAVDVGTLSDTDDLYEAGGMTSFASVQLMLALEEAFDVEFPETMLKRRTFASVANIAASLSELAVETV
jgi:acyl carrier protein